MSWSDARGKEDRRRAGLRVDTELDVGCHEWKLPCMEKAPVADVSLTLTAVVVRHLLLLG